MEIVCGTLICSSDLHLDLFRQNWLYWELWMKVNICQDFRFSLSCQYSTGCIHFVSERIQFPSLMGFHWTWVSHEYCLSRSRKHWIWSSVRHCSTLQGNETSFSENSIHVICHHQNYLHWETLYTEKKISSQKQPQHNTLPVHLISLFTETISLNILTYSDHIEILCNFSTLHINIFFRAYICVWARHLEENLKLFQPL